MNRVHKQLVAVLMIGSLAACGGVTSPSQNKTETISGTIQRGSSITSSYNVAKAGEFTVTVTNLTPPVPTNMVFLIAVYQGGCGVSLVGYNPTAVIGTAVSGSVLVPGTYCVQIGDIGAFTADETVTGTFSHP
jgi:hypothetical protein